MAVVDGDVIKVVVNIDMPDLVLAQNVYYWRLQDLVPDTPTNAQILTAVDDQITAMYQTVDQDMVTTSGVSDADVTRVEWNVDHWENVENIGNVVIGVTGGTATDMAPHGCAATITADTMRPQSRGRKFLPAFAESFFTGSTIGGTLLTDLALFVTQWLTDKGVVGAAKLIPVILGQSGPAAGDIMDIVAGVISAIVGYQRRRKPGVGV